MLKHVDWSVKVGEVFNTKPRVGVSDAALWLERQTEQQLLREAFQRPAVHVCLDGPSGVGKTSLAFTHIFRERLPHFLVQLTSNMTWPEFCRQLVIQSRGSSRPAVPEWEIGLDRGLPTSKLRRKGRSEDLTGIDQQARSWTESDVARLLVKEQAALLIDDLEKANEALMQRVADLGKLLTESYVSPNAKLLLVGTGDIYRRLLKADPSLDERLAEVSLGAFPRPGDSWRFLILGFKRLGLLHPASSRFGDQQRQVGACISAAYEAADGLPKSLNRLGAEIALNARGGRPGVTADDIIGQSRRMAMAHWREYAHDYPDLVKCLRSDDAAFEVVKQLYLDGIGSVHDCRSLVDSLVGRSARRGQVLDDVTLEAALDNLVRVGFLVRTGVSGEVAYCGHPTAAHTLGVVMRSPFRYRGAEALLQGIEQLELPFGIITLADHPGRTFDGEQQ